MMHATGRGITLYTWALFAWGAKHMEGWRREYSFFTFGLPVWALGGDLAPVGRKEGARTEYISKNDSSSWACQ